MKFRADFILAAHAAIAVIFIMSAGVQAQTPTPAEASLLDDRRDAAAPAFLSLAAGEKLSVTCSDGELVISVVSAPTVDIDCLAPVTSTSTSTSASESKLESEPMLTETPASAPTSIPAAERAGRTDPYRGAPECEHDREAYHALWDSEGGCHHNHEHGDDPSEVDDLFGPVGAFYGQPGQPFPFPWQTCGYDGKFTGDGENYPACQGAYENDVMHEAYKFYVRRGAGCFSRFENGCVRAFRALAHADGHDHGAKIRYHSMMLEALVAPEARPWDVALVRTGGWEDKGGLNLDQTHVDGFGPNIGASGGVRLHYRNVGNDSFGDWYGGTFIGAVVTEFGDMWTYVDGAPVEHGAHSHPMEFRCGADPRIGEVCNTNNSYRQIHLVGVALRGVELRWLRQHGFAGPDESGIEKVNFEGYTDRYGTIVKDGSCREPGLDCVPLVLQNYDPSMRYQYRGDYRQYDTSPEGEHWIEWPN